MAALASPTLLGIFVVLSVLTGDGVGDLVATSELVSSVALVVGAVLILGSLAIYVRYPKRYETLQETHAEQLQALQEELNELQKQRETGGSDGAGKSRSPSGR